MDAIQHFAKIKPQVHSSSPSFHPTCRNFTYLFCLGQEKTTQKCNEIAIVWKISPRRGYTYIFQRFFGTVVGSISDFLQQSTSSKTFNHLNCWQDICWKCWKTENEKAHNSTEITNRKWEIEPAQYYLKCQNVLIINSIWLETVWSWSLAVSISRARQICSYKDLGIYLHCNLCLNPKVKKVKSYFLIMERTYFLLQNMLLFIFSPCHSSFF